MGQHTGQRRQSAAAAALVGLVALVALAAVGLHSTSATAASSNTQKANSGSLTIGSIVDVTSLDPAKSTIGYPDWQLYSYVYDRLVTQGQNLDIQPDLATSWKILPSKTLPNKIWVFNIRKGVHFSNGRELTVGDVVGSLRRLVDPNNVNTAARYIGPVASVVASGKWQVKITLETPNGALLAALAHPDASILPMKEWVAGTFDPKTQLLGTGPFKVVSHIPKESWTFKRNPYYWRKGFPKADTLTEKIIGDDAARIAALRDGSIDATWFDNPDAVSLLKGVPNVKTHVMDTTNFNYLGVNARSSIFSDPRLRQALELALNRKQLIDTAFAGVGRPSAAISPGYGVCNPNAMPNSTQNVQRARSLVAAAGATGKSVTISAPSYDSTLLPIAQVLQQQLNAIGLKVSVVPISLGDLVSKIYNAKSVNFDLVVNWFTGLGDPAMVLRNWIGSVAGYDKLWLAPNQPLLRSILKTSLTEPGSARDKLMFKTCQLIAADASIIPLSTRGEVIAYRSDRVNPILQKTEGYSQPLQRNIWQFAPR